MKKLQLIPTAILVLAFALVLSATNARNVRAESFAEKCGEIASCAKTVSELTGQKYIFDADVKGKSMSTSNVEINKDNAELLFTDLLNVNGFARVPTGEPNTYQIMRQRDARDAPIVTVTADQNKAPELPKTWDLMTLRYRATNPEAVETIARLSRSFMPANSRIIPDELGGMLLITDTALNLKKLYEMIKDMDRKPSAELKKRWEEAAKARAAQGFGEGHGQRNSGSGVREGHGDGHGESHGPGEKSPATSESHG